MKPLKISATANANLQNAINTSIIFNHIRENGPRYRAQIVRDLGLSAPAVSRAVEYLQREGFLIESKRNRTGSGKLASWFSVNPDKGYVIGVDLIASPAKLAIFDYACTLKEELRSSLLIDGKDPKTGIIKALESIIGQHGTTGNISAISFGLPAVIGAHGNAAGAALYGDLEGVNLKEILEPIFGIPVFAENTANLAALAESRFGIGRGSHSFVFIEVSNGIGAGIVQEGNLIRGRQGAAGEIGYGLIESGGATLERRASLIAVGTAGIRAIEESPGSVLAKLVGNPQSCTARKVFEAASQGCATSRGLIAETTELLATAVQHVVLLLDPELVIIGGEICDFPGIDELVVGPLRSKVGECLPFAKPAIELSRIGHSAGVLGAATFALESLVLRRYPYKLQN